MRFAIGRSASEGTAKLANVPGTRRYAPTQLRRRKTDWSTNGSPLDMCRQMAPPQKPLVNRTPRDAARGTRRRTALTSSPAPITWIGTPKPSFATCSGGKRPRTLAEPARSMLPPTRPCSTHPAMVFQLRVAFIVRSPSGVCVVRCCTIDPRTTGSKNSLGPAGNEPSRATGAALDLRGANEDGGPRRRNPAEIRHAFETPLVAAEQRLVGLELLARPDVQRDRVDADAGNVALGDQELAGILGEAREVERVRLIGAQVGLGVAGLHVPARIHEHVAPPGQATMILLPRLHVIDGHGTVRVTLGAPADVDDRSRDDQVAHGKLFHGLGIR